MPTVLRSLLFPLLALSLLALLPRSALSATPCTDGPTGGDASRIAAVACREHVLWYSPFIDAEGRLASSTVSEAETATLGDGATPAWRRVAAYWRESGLLPRMAGFAGGSDCAYAAVSGMGSPACRAFVLDQPWSAAFVSWVMVQAGVPGFRPSASHVDFVRQAHAQPASSPFRFANLDVEPAAVGDLLCYVRSPAREFGHEGLRAFLAAGEGGLPMHCDVVVTAAPGGGSAYLVGGNVLQGVTMRTVTTNRQGLPWNLPRGAGRSTTCWPGSPGGCSFNRQDWAVLLKLRPASELAGLPRPVMPVPAGLSPAPAAQTCCINCVVGSGVPRCPVPPTP